MRSSFIAATVLSSALDLFTRADALALPLRRSPIESRQSAASGAQALANFASGEAYVTNITINGQSFAVQIDTGSADLWVQTTTPVPGAFDSTVGTQIQYGSDSVKGHDKFATVSVGGFNITNQVYMEVPPQTGDGFPGIMGLGPSKTSSIFTNTAVEDDRANSSLVSLFTQNAAAEPFFTYQLNRLTELPDPSPGTITFAEVISELSNITSQPKLPVIIAPADEHFKQWGVVMDGMIVNGKNVTLPPSGVDPKNTSQFVAILDTGTTGTVVPKELFSAIYGGLSGAVNNTDGTQSFPCNSEVNVTFIFGGQEFPMHPLDTLFPSQHIPGMCDPLFQQGPGDEQRDALLGNPVLRSLYALHHFGDSIRGGPNQPYVQLLPTLDVAKAHEEFVQVRITNANSTTTASSGTNSTVSATGATASATGSLIFPSGAATGTSAAASATDASSGAAATGSASSVAGTGSGTASATDSATTTASAGASAAATGNAVAAASDVARRAWRSRR